MFKRFLLVLVLIPFLSGSVVADPVKNATFEEFQWLVKLKVSQMPELEALWETKLPNPVYMGGGILRGLLAWLEKELRTHSLEEVTKMRTPPIENLIQEGADQDLFYKTEYWLESAMPEFEEWDVLPEKFYRKSVEAGGLAIEKLRVNPKTIEDPYGGLLAFYNGTLKYKDSPESTFSRFRKSTGELNSNMKSALVLRALRIANDMPSMEIDLKTKELLQAVVKDEAPLVKPGNYWIQKALKKFFISTGNDVKKTLETLKKYGLRDALAKNAYVLVDEKLENFKKRKFLLFEIPAEEISVEDFNHFKKSTYAVEETLEGMKHVLQKVKSTDRFFATLSPLIKNPSDEYLSDIDSLISKSLDIFFGTNPSFSDLIRLKKMSTTVETTTKIMDRSIEYLRVSKELNTEQFFKILAPDIPRPDEEYIDSINVVLNKSLSAFFKLDPDMKEILRCKKISSQVDTSIDLMRRSLKYLKKGGKLTTADFFNIIKPEIPNPSNDYLVAISELMYETVDLFFELNPTASDLNRFKKISVSINTNIEVMKRGLQAARTVRDMELTLSPGVDSPDESYLTAIQELIESSEPLFEKLIANASSTKIFFDALSFSIPSESESLAPLNETASKIFFKIIAQNSYAFLKADPTEKEKLKFQTLTGIYPSPQKINKSHCGFPASEKFLDNYFDSLVKK